MPTTHSGPGWEVTVDGDVMVWTFTEVSVEALRDEAFPVYEELLAQHNCNALVTIVQLDDPFTESVFKLWQKAAKRADEEGIERWGVVADGIKKISLRGKVDVGGLDVYTSENIDEVVEWAASGE